MKVKMLVDVSGPRPGRQTWPRRGGELDVSDREGQKLVSRGLAVEVADKPAKPKATAPPSRATTAPETAADGTPAETADEPKPKRRRATTTAPPQEGANEPANEAEGSPSV